MTKITLRSYNREIEGLTNQGKIDIAIAHCLHILKYFPKHVDTYRLLGKAYLENQRLGDAADIFQRVLSAIPDDFVSHIGMSIIREDEGNIDAAIWHMQRAYDVQSSNITIQDELRRLFDERDGIEPPKIRLTRAALARMYARGDLINEAIIELRSALQEEPDRADLLVLLSRMYYTNNQRVKSIQSCSQVLNKLPFCLDANVIMSQALTDTNRVEEAQPYTEKAKELDPYTAYLSEHAPTVNLVPDAAVTLRKLDETQITSSEAQPTWVASLGEEMPAAKSESDIDWLLEDTETKQSTEPEEKVVDEFEDDEAFAARLATSAAFGTLISDSEIDEGDAPTSPENIETDSETEIEDEIPDWLQDAGWESRDPGKEETEATDLLDTESDALAPAEIPEWLQAMAPGTSSDEPDSETTETHEAETALSDEATLASVDIPDWLKDLDVDGDETVTTESEPAESETEALTQLFEEETTQASVDVPDWLKELDVKEDTSTEQDAEEIADLAAQISDDSTQPAIDVPDWLQDLETDGVEPTTAQEEIAATTEDVPDWLAVAATVESTEEAPAAEIDQEAVPEWLSELGEVEATDSDQESSVVSAEDIPDWLSEMTESEEPETEIATPEIQAVQADTTETAPDWLEELLEEEPAAETELGEIAVDVQAAAEAAGEIDESEMPDWLSDMDEPEGLATEIATTDVEEVTSEAADTAPDWLEEMLKEEPTVEASLGEIAEDVQATVEETSKAAADVVPDWLEEIAEEKPAAEVTMDDATEDVGAAAEETAADLEGEETSADAAEEELPDWLEEMAKRAGESSAPTIDRTGVTLWLHRDEDDDERETDEEFVDQEAAHEANLAFDENQTAQMDRPEDVEILAETEAIEDIPAWLQGFDEEITSEPQETTAEVDEPSEEMPSQAVDEALAEVSEEPEVVEAAEDVELLNMPNMDDTDAALRWLESLAAKQGAKEEELLTSPEERTDTPPAWVQSMADEAAAEETAEEAQETTETVLEIPAEEDDTEAPAEITADVDTLIWDELEDTSSSTEAGETVEAAEDLSWLEELATQDAAEVSTSEQTVEPAAELDDVEKAEEDVPDWLKAKLDKPVEADAGDIPDWLQDIEITDEAEETKLSAAPSSLDEFDIEEEQEATPAEELLVDEAETQATATEPLADAEQEGYVWEQEKPEDEPEAEPATSWWSKNTGPLSEKVIEQAPDAEPTSETLEVEKTVEETVEAKPTVEAETIVSEPKPEPTAASAPIFSEILSSARAALSQGDVAESINQYKSLIKKKVQLNDIIDDLTKAVQHNHPVNIDIWATLGDAYARNDNIQKALDAYTKAEELIR